MPSRKPWIRRLGPPQILTVDAPKTPPAPAPERIVPRILALLRVRASIIGENYPLESSLQKRVQNLEIESVLSFEKTNYALTLTVVPGEELALKIGYSSNRFADAAIPFGIASLHARMLGHLQTLLEGMTANPERKLSELPLLSAAERQQLLVQWNDTQADYPKNS